MATKFYRFRNGQLSGLIRRTDGPDGLVIERVGDQEWVDDSSLLGLWVDPGDFALVEVDRDEAQRAADGYGVELDGERGRPATKDERDLATP